MANELATYRASTVGSEEILYFINVPNTAGDFTDKDYHMALLMAESNTMDSGVETEDVPDVTTKVAGHVIKSYKKTFTHEGVYLKGEPVCEYERYLFDNDEVGDKTVVDLLQVYTFEGNNVSGYKAYKYVATCEVSAGVGGEAQGKANIGATYTITSEAVEGLVTYDTESGVAEFTALTQSENNDIINTDTNNIPTGGYPDDNSGSSDDEGGDDEGGGFNEDNL